MKTRSLGVCLVLAFGLAWPAWALWASSTITPESIEDSGFTVTAKPYKEDSINFIVTRDMSKAHQPGDLEFVVRPSATLEVYGESGLVVRCPVHAEEDKGSVSFTFSVGKASIATAHLTFYESLEYRDRDKQREVPLLGGGSMYEFDLGKFAAGTK